MAASRVARRPLVRLPPRRRREASFISPIPKAKEAARAAAAGVRCGRGPGGDASQRWAEIVDNARCEPERPAMNTALYTETKPAELKAMPKRAALV